MPFTPKQQEQLRDYMQAILYARMSPEEISKAEEKGATFNAYKNRVDQLGNEAAEKEALNGLKQLLINEINLDDDESGESRECLKDVKRNFNECIEGVGLDPDGDKVLATINTMMDIHINGHSFLEDYIKMAASLGSVDCFRLLEKLYGVSWDYRIDTPFGDWTALHFIANTRGTEIVEFWRKQQNGEGFNIDVRDGQGNTPLCHAVRRNAIEMVRYLLMNRADINARNFYAMTPLAQAAFSEYAGVEMLRVLIEHGADVNAEIIEDAYTHRTLDGAIKSGAVEKVRLLLENGARISEESYQSIRAEYHGAEIRALLDDYAPAGHAEIDDILDNLRRPRILREVLLTPSDESNPSSTLSIPDLVKIIVDYARQEDVTPDDKSAQKGPAMSRIARVRQALQKDLPALLAGGIITAKEQVAAKDEIISKLKNEDLQAECRMYCDQRQQAQAPDTIVPPWAQYKVEVLKTASPSESKGMEATSITTTSAQSSVGHLEISEAKEVTAEAKGMPRVNSVPSDQTHRDTGESLNATALGTSGIGFYASTVKTDGKPQAPNVSQKAEGDAPLQQELDADSSGSPKSGPG